MIEKTTAVELGTLTPKVITKLDTTSGYLQVLEYTLQDSSYLHVVQWHFCNELNAEGLPKINSIIHYRDKISAVEQALEIGSDLLKCI